MIKIKPFKQSPGFCGPACLKMIFSYYGVEKSEKELARISKCSRKMGVNAKGLLSAARLLGFKGAVRDYSSFEEIESYLKKNVPVIVAWFSTDEKHYSVVVDIDREYIYLQDPEIGRVRKLELGIFKKTWFDFPGEFIKSIKDLVIRRIIVIHP